jgi:uncharacterized membrane protein YhaH (DUF805 family)
MSTYDESRRRPFWRWIVFAFLLGAVIGLVIGVGGLIVLQALISYVPPAA